MKFAMEAQRQFLQENNPTTGLENNVNQFLSGINPLIWLALVGTLFFAAAAKGEDFYGSMYVEDSLVHYIQPEQKWHGIPIIMIPGLNLSSYIYVTTPDGRDGWAQAFAAKGFDVYVINDPDFDFLKGGFSVSPFIVPTEGAPPLDPSSSQAWQNDVWRRWGFGESEGNPYPDTRFPTDYFAVFKANFPYVSSSATSYADAIVALLQTTGPAVLMAHSAGGPQAVNAALARPDLVRGFIMIEPTNPPDGDDFPALAGMSMFGVYGDYIDSRNQGSRKAGTEAAAVLFSQNGGVGEVVSLPDDLGINGNTHLMMQDNNNLFIADLIITWLCEHISPAIGDTNGDNLVDLADAILALQVLTGSKPAALSPRADINQDSKIGLEEAINTLQVISGRKP